MNEYLLQARYTGVGPRSGVWLNAQEQDFLVIDKHRTRKGAQAEERRLRTTNYRFLAPTDWETRIVESVPAKPKRVAVPPSEDEAPKPKKKRTRKKKHLEPKV